MVRYVNQLLLLLLPAVGWSQGFEPMLEDLRAACGESVRFSIGGDDQLIIAFHDHHGLVRQDIVPLLQIDAGRLEYSLQDDAVVIPCDSLHARCIRSEHFRSSSTRLCGQVMLPRPLNDAGGHDLIESLRAITSACQDRLVETQPRGLRKN